MVMWEFLGSPQCAQLISLAMLAVAWRSKPPAASTEMVRQHRFSLSRRAIFVVLAVAFYGYGFYRTHQLEKQLDATQQELEEMKIISSWGPNGATLNTAMLKKYADKYKAMLIFRLDVRSVNYLTDNEIVKSYLFEIDGKKLPVEVPPYDNLFWSRLPSSAGYIQVYPVVIPKTVMEDRIKCLADVQLHKGRIFEPRAIGQFAIISKKKIEDAHQNEVPTSH